MEVVRSALEVDTALNAAIARANSGSQWPGMSYEQGVEAAISWLLGWSDDNPMEGA
jgi:hypothetical protein